MFNSVGLRMAQRSLYRFLYDVSLSGDLRGSGGSPRLSIETVLIPVRVSICLCENVYLIDLLHEANEEIYLIKILGA
jgi:hypothetical protein